MRTIEEIENDIKKFNEDCDKGLKALYSFQMNHNRFKNNVKKENERRNK